DPGSVRLPGPGRRPGEAPTAAIARQTVAKECSAMQINLRFACLIVASTTVVAVTTAGEQATLHVEDYLVMPMTGSVDGNGSNEVLLSRVNSLREEAGGARRQFISDLNGPL